MSIGMFHLLEDLEGMARGMSSSETESLCERMSIKAQL